MAEVLTVQQQEAVMNRGGNLLVSAAAGSGKTKVLVDRLLTYLSDPNDPANLDEFLIITYTKAAAAELRGKIAAKLSERIALEPANKHLQQQMQRLYLTKISTVHAFCADILREYAYMTDLPADFRVADENECQEIQMQVIEHLLDQAYGNVDADPDFQAFINSQGFGRNDQQIPEILLKVYNSAKCHLNMQQWLDWCLEIVETDVIADASETVWGNFLLEDLRSYLSLQINALARCVEAAAATSGMEKQASLLQDTVFQLTRLKNASTWDEIVRHKNIDYGRLVFSKGCKDTELAERIKAIRKACKKGLDRKLRSFSSSSEQVLCDLQKSAAAVKGLIHLVREFDSAYSSRKKARRVLDFGDLEHRMLDLLVGKNRLAPTSLAIQIGARFREIMVDEYQDSNGVQDAIFHALTSRKQNCFMVGDVKQSIYQFRLADPGIFIEKYNTYKSVDCAKTGEGRKVLLSSNFRSSNGVLQGANDVFSCCMSPEVGGISYNENEMLREGIPHIPLNEPEVALYGIDVQEDTYAEEAAFVAKRIKKLLDGNHMVRNGDSLRPIKAEDIVILLRSPGSVGGEFAYALEQLGIRCTSGGNVDLLQKEEVTVLRSLLEVISNPLQDIPLVSVLTSRIFGFTADDLAGIRGRYRKCSIYESLFGSEDEKSHKFIRQLELLRQEARLYSLSQLLQRIYFHTNIDSIFAAMPDGTDKKRNLDIFCQIASDYEAGGSKDLQQFLNYLEHMEKKGLTYASDQQSSGAVTIMSIHKSKGLEFPVVFLCGLSRGFNQESSRAQVLCHKELGLGLSWVDTKNRVSYPTIAKRAIAEKITADSISEEMRVLYVAMTRARDRLIMTYAVKNLADDLLDIALRMDMSDRQLMTGNADCPGTWVLLTAMQRTEAGAFFQLGGRPDQVSVSDTPWHIRVVQEDPLEGTGIGICEEGETITEDAFHILEKSLNFTYPHIYATHYPSKQTATQLKGRMKDQEAAESTQVHYPHFFRKPGHAVTRKAGTDRGNAYHALLQFIRYENCGNVDAICQELEKLVCDNRLTKDQRDLIDPAKIFRLFDTPLGRKLRNHEDVLREFKFSILDDGARYGQSIAGEQILLQGVVDCAMMDPDGIIVIDFKTDHVTEDTVEDVVAGYKGQVMIYADAMQRIFEQRVKAKYLYMFALDRFVEI